MRRSAGGSTAVFGPSRDDTGGWPDVSAGNPRVYARSSRRPAEARSVAGDVLDLRQALAVADRRDTKELRQTRRR